jgi:hypothetical protein
MTPFPPRPPHPPSTHTSIPIKKNPHHNPNLPRGLPLHPKRLHLPPDHPAHRPRPAHHHRPHKPHYHVVYGNFGANSRHRWRCGRYVGSAVAVCWDAGGLFRGERWRGRCAVFGGCLCCVRCRVRGFLVDFNFFFGFLFI